MTNWKKALLPLGILVGGIAVVMVIATSKPKPKPKDAGDGLGLKIAVSVQKVVRENKRLNVSGQGTVEARREIDLIAQVAGQVVSVQPNFVDGAFFDKDQVLIQIDDRDYQIAYLAAKARLADANRRLAEEKGLAKQARREWVDRGDKEANTLFLREPQMAAAQAAVLSAEGEVRKAKLDLERTKIKVPFNGRIVDTFVDLGQHVSPNTPLAKVLDTSTAEIRIPLKDEQIGLLDIPLNQKFSSNNKLPNATLSGKLAGDLAQWQGKVARTDASIDLATRMHHVVVEVNDPFGLASQAPSVPLLPGLFVEVEIEGKNIEGTIELPRSALYKRQLILALDENNKVQVHQVKVLRKTEEKVWILADLKEGQPVVLEKQSLIDAGQEVKPIVVSDTEIVEGGDDNQVELSTQEQLGNKS